MPIVQQTSRLFQSTLLMRGATCVPVPVPRYRCRFQSTLLMRGATQADNLLDLAPIISIHAPHARSDPAFLYSRRIRFKFQSTLLMRGATSSRPLTAMDTWSFQSTLLMRGATLGTLCHTAHVRISIHAPHARSDILAIVFAYLLEISIHAPHARSDEGDTWEPK